MSNIFEDFIKFLDEENKEEAVQLIISKLDNKELDIIKLYDEILTPSLNTKYCMEGETLCIWKEHVRTSTVRTIIECCYPYIIKERKEKGITKTNKKVIMVCPSEEYHEIGARMIVDFFIMLGFDGIFIGANTPREEIINAISVLQPMYVGISITNYYNLVEAEKIIKLFKTKLNSDTKIIVGGNAIYTNPEIFERLGADHVYKSYDDIKNLVEGK